MSSRFLKHCGPWASGLALVLAAAGASAEPAPAACRPSASPSAEPPSRAAEVGLASAWKSWTERRAKVVDLRRGAVEANIRLDAGLPWAAQPRGWEIAAIRKAGTWRVVWRGYRTSGRKTTRTAWNAKVLRSAQGAELDRLLADQCLWTAPAYLDGVVVTREGVEAPCIGGPRTDFDIRAGRRHWGGTHLCSVEGAPGALRVALLRATLGPGAWGSPAPRTATLR